MGQTVLSAAAKPPLADGGISGSPAHSGRAAADRDVRPTISQRTLGSVAMKRTLILAGILLVSGGGCSTMNNTEAGAAGGGILGGLIGTVAGAASGHPLAGAAIGAGAGALAG